MELFGLVFNMMILSVEYFHSMTHQKQVLMSQLQCARVFMRSVKEALKRSHSWLAFYFTKMKGSPYLSTESCIEYRELSLV